MINISETEINYDRLLFGQVLNKSFSIHNTSQIPVKWKINPPEDLAEEYSISQLEGTLNALDQTVVDVTFRAMQRQEKFNQTLQVTATDVENMNVAVTPINVNL